MVSAVVDRGNGGPREWRTWTVLLHELLCHIIS